MKDGKDSKTSSTLPSKFYLYIYMYIKETSSTYVSPLLGSTLLLFVGGNFVLSSGGDLKVVNGNPLMIFPFVETFLFLVI